MELTSLSAADCSSNESTFSDKLSTFEADRITSRLCRKRCHEVRRNHVCAPGALARLHFIMGSLLAICSRCSAALKLPLVIEACVRPTSLQCLQDIARHAKYYCSY